MPTSMHQDIQSFVSHAMRFLGPAVNRVTHEHVISLAQRYSVAQRWRTQHERSVIMLHDDAPNGDNELIKPIPS